MHRLLRYIFIASIIVCIILPVLYVVNSWPTEKHHRVYTQPSQGWRPFNEQVKQPLKEETFQVTNGAMPHSQRKCESTILIINHFKGNPILKKVLLLIQAQRINYKVYSVPFVKGKVPDLVTHKNMMIGKYCIILILDMLEFVRYNSLHQLFEEYCAKFGASLMFMAQENIQIHYNDIKLYSLPSTTSLLRVHEQDNFEYLKNGGLWRWRGQDGLLVSAQVIKDLVLHAPSVYEPLNSDRFQTLISLEFNTSHHLPLSFIDWKSSDNIIRGYIGMPLEIPLTKLVFLEIVQLIAHDILRFHNQRWIQVDIDDTFVAPKGLKPTAADVKAIIAAQKSFQQYIPGFTFHMGFCGFYYAPSDINGDSELIINANEFNWFPHIFNHMQPHLLPLSHLMTLMQSNKDFALKHGIPISDTHYAVSPHHSGVYPVYKPIYSLWKSVYNITVTSTEEYPHLYPSHLRRGFIHSGVKVLPRQTCRLFTHTNYFSDFLGGREGLLSVSEGGELFDTILNNPISIFMTHTSNYAQDRLALLLFDTGFKFIKTWSKLELLAQDPIKLADRYFNTFPEDKVPLWTNPYDDKRHRSIWHMTNASRLPSVIIVGPQKTGTTALHLFLKLHPQLVANNPTPLAFEEIQFFSNEDLYNEGIDWYMSTFPDIPVSSSKILFEKSATYFTHTLAPMRVHTLLPNVRIVVVLTEPSKRAYSWYQHMRAHNDPTALLHNFTTVLRTSRTNLSKKLLSLRTHCLSPGIYHEHLSRWFTNFPSNQIHIVDGEELSINPESVLADLTKSLQLVQFDFSKKLRYDSKKKFYCILDSNDKKVCLGKGKGRVYPSMLSEDAQYLTQYYSSHNRKLYQLLLHYSKKPPLWLTNRNL